MKAVVLENIRADVDSGELTRKLSVANKEILEEAQCLLSDALRVAKPKVVYKTAYITEHGKDFVVIEDVVYNSRVLRTNLDNIFKVFPYIATSGVELDAWVNSHHDPLTRYLADVINEMFLQNTVIFLKSLLAEQNSAGYVSTMNPGSLADWPLSEQVKLFNLLGSPKDSIQVRLTDSFLMLPIKSVSGIAFLTEVLFQNCQLCPRDKCPGRKARYDPDLYRRKYCDSNT